MKNKNTGLSVGLKNSDYVSSIIYETESVTNADTDFTMAATVNADNEAAKKLKIRVLSIIYH